MGRSAVSEPLSGDIELAYCSLVYRFNMKIESGLQQEVEEKTQCLLRCLRAVIPLLNHYQYEAERPFGRVSALHA
jgi:hypothetical protein